MSKGSRERACKRAFVCVRAHVCSLLKYTAYLENFRNLKFVAQWNLQTRAFMQPPFTEMWTIATN